MIHASEDVGLADNSALATAVAASQAVEKIGYPEAQIVLAHAALHIALAPKSNSVCRAIGEALAYVQSAPLAPIPADLRDAHYAGAVTLGHGGYKTPHSAPHGYIARSYAPTIPPGRFYRPEARTAQSYETRAAAHLAELKAKVTPPGAPSPTTITSQMPTERSLTPRK